MGRMYRPVKISYGDSSMMAVAILDTGSDETVISEKAAREVGARLYGSFSAICASRKIIEGRYADIRIKDSRSGLEALMEVGVSNLPFDTDDIDDEGLDVILGVDFIQETGLKI